MNPYTCIGHFQSAPHEPTCHLVEAQDITGAIDAATREANDGKPDNPLDPFAVTFVMAGHVEVLTTWAG